MKILELLKSRDPQYQRSIWFFLGAYFFVLFNYPLVRATTTTLFFEKYGAKSSPQAWLWTVLFLTASILILNKLQSRFRVQKVFLWVSAFSTILFTASVLGFIYNVKFLTFFAFIWKEVYIVLQVHLLLAYVNIFIKKEDFKAIIGPVGATGSIGGVFGGLLTSYVSDNWGTIYVAWLSLAFVLVPALFFIFTASVRKESEKEKAPSPISSLSEPKIRKYVFLVATVVMLSQFIINIADFQFNLSFEANVATTSQRTSYLGWIYTWTNLLTFVIQFLCLPFILPRISEKSLHIFLPISYLISLICLVYATGNVFLPTAIFYVYLKAADYSMFSAGKELLYQPLTPNQKYGAKYLTDMFVYRVSKALIAAVLIYLQTPFILNMMMITCLVLWLIIVIKIFGIHRRLFS